MSGRQKRNAFAVIHFGGNPKYLELELYFFKMLRQYTRNDIVYLFSVNDTPPAFVDAVRPLVTEVIPYDDRGITYEVPFKSEYKNFNTLRTCNFIFAYTLDKYDKVCIIESDMVIMKNLDPIFNLKTPAVLTYYIGDRNLKFHDRVRNDRRDVLDKCRDMGRINGGVMVINPSPQLFTEYKAKIVDVVQRNCKYPNETLFEYVNNDYFNLPVQYNLSHYHAQPARLQSYQLDPGDIFVYHFNETDYKHIDIIKNPVDEKGDNWLELIDRQPKYVIRKLPIFHYKRSVFDRYRMVIEPLMIEAMRPKVSEAKVTEAKVVEKPVSDKPVVEKPVAEKPVADKVAEKPVAEKPVVEKPVAEKPVAEEKVIVNPKIPSPIKKEKCPKGTRRNKKTGLCDKAFSSSSSSSVEASLPKAETKASLPKAETKASLPKAKESLTPLPNCPKGTRRNKKTGLCEPYAKGPLGKAASNTESKASLPKAESNASLPKAESNASLPKTESKASLPKAESKASLPKAESKASLPKAESKASLSKTGSKAEAKESLPINTKKCPKGTRRNRRTGICEPKIVPLQLEPIQAKQPEAKQPKVEAKQPEIKQLSRCPKGTHRNKKTGECVPNK
jgi:lipopolysaccharide biosynthesis glycosyltransferase